MFRDGWWLVQEPPRESPPSPSGQGAYGPVCLTGSRGAVTEVRAIVCSGWDSFSPSLTLWDLGPDCYLILDTPVLSNTQRIYSP